MSGNEGFFILRYGPITAGLDLDSTTFYGDSDGDITDSRVAEHCTPYRFLRNQMILQYNSLNYSPGQYGESVVEGSDC